LCCWQWSCHLQPGLLGEQHSAIRHGPQLTRGSKTPEPLQRSGREALALEVLELVLAEAESVQYLERPIDTGAQNERSIARRARKQAERRRLGHAQTRVRLQHAKLVQVGVQSEVP